MLGIYVTPLKRFQFWDCNPIYYLYNEYLNSKVLKLMFPKNLIKCPFIILQGQFYFFNSICFNSDVGQLMTRYHLSHLKIKNRVFILCKTCCLFLSKCILFLVKLISDRLKWFCSDFEVIENNAEKSNRKIKRRGMITNKTMIYIRQKENKMNICKTNWISFRKWK